MFFKFCVCFVLLTYANSAMVMEKPEQHRQATPAETYAVNLDLPPLERWQVLANVVDPGVLTNGIRFLLRTVLPNDALVELVELIAADLNKYFSQPYADEIRGLAKAVKVPLGDLVLANIVYDLSAFDSSNIRACTSIVAADSDGKIYQGRNLDYDAPQFLKNLTIQVNFMKGGKSLFMGTSYIGYVGTITGCKHGVFSMSGDQRNKGLLVENLISMLEGSKATFFNQRMILETATSFSDALSMAMNNPTIAPVYYIVGGMKPNEGAIVVRNARTLANVTRLGDYKTHPWYLVETNYDPWNAPPASDDRRDAAIAAMNKVGRNNVSAENLYKVLSSPLVFNSQTTYTTIMSAADSSVYKTMIRFDWPESK